MRKLILVLLIITFVTSTAYASSTGTIKGRVTINNKPIVGAEVILITEDMETLIKTTDNQGYYLFDNISYGKYLITVKANGKFYLNYKIKK